MVDSRGSDSFLWSSWSLSCLTKATAPWEGTGDIRCTRCPWISGSDWKPMSLPRPRKPIPSPHGRISAIAIACASHHISSQPSQISPMISVSRILDKHGTSRKVALLFLLILFLKIFIYLFISLRLITLQYCSGFCHTLTWISHGYTCIPHPYPPSHLPLHPIPLGLPSAPGPSTCLMHPTWAGDLFHPR